LDTDTHTHRMRGMVSPVTDDFTGGGKVHKLHRIGHIGHMSLGHTTHRDGGHSQPSGQSPSGGDPNRKGAEPLSGRGEGNCGGEVRKVPMKKRLGNHLLLRSAMGDFDSLKLLKK